jgi:hypothetical protein
MLFRVTFALAARIVATLAAAVVIAGSCAAKDVKIGSADITMDIPDGFCELTEDEPADARAIKIIGNLVAGVKNELLTIAADCSQLKAWRTGELPTLDDYLQYQTLAAAKNSNFSRGPEIKDFCASIRAQGGQMIAGISPDVNARLEEAIKGAKFNEPTFLGVLAEDADSCTFGLMQKVQTEAGNEKVQVTIAATTVVKGKIVYYNYYTVHRDRDTVPAALARHQRNVAAMLAANGG